MKYFKWYTWVGIGLVFFVLTIVLGRMTVFVKDVTHTEAISVKVKSEQVEPDIQIDTETKESDSFMSVISIPYTEITEVDQTVKDWTKKKEQTFYDEMDTKDPFFGKANPAQFSIDTVVSKLDDDLYHVTLHMTQSVDGKDDTTSVKTIAFKKEGSDGKVLKLDDIIKDSKKKKKELATLLEKQTDSEMNHDKLKALLSDFNQLDWKMDEKEQEMIFYFDSGEISNQSEEINVSFLDFYPFLTDEYYDRFVSDEMMAKIDEEIAEEQRQKEEKLQQKKMVAITFDDGPHPTETDRVLNILDTYDAKATFFMLSKNVKQYPSIAKKVRDKGHEIANHSITHANLKAVNSDKVRQEVVESANTIENVLGVHPTLFRPPYGNYNDQVLGLAEESKQSIILWSVDTRDWENLNVNQIYQNVMANTHPGSIILLHDIHATTADSLPKILKGLKNEGYEFVTVSDLMPYIEGDGVGPYYGE